jgi:hypothetical protein
MNTIIEIVIHLPSVLLGSLFTLTVAAIVLLAERIRTLKLRK